ncbi:MAG: hypothetical protein WD490_00070 [Opitutales bacterium]
MGINIWGNTGAVAPGPVKVVVIACLVATGATFVLWQTVDNALEEHHVIESAQAVGLSLAAALHCARMRAAKIAGSFSLHATLALLSFSLVLREVDVDALGVQAFWANIQLMLRIVAVGLWVVLTVHLVRQRKILLRLWHPLVFSPCSRFVWGGIGLYLLSWPFDKELVPLPPATSVFFEEALQLNAATLFLIGVLLARGIENPRFR